MHIMNLGNNGHWKAEILPVARFGSNTAAYKHNKPGDLNYDADTLDVLTELFDNADNNIPDDILNTQTTRGSPQVPHVDKLVPNHTLPDSPPYSALKRILLITISCSPRQPVQKHLTRVPGIIRGGLLTQPTLSRRR
ncbi:hypothetical protein EB796_018800 [Bugula neritina]|uniref:Uncharacterized protein n=1 Tax=Bugula neritina TaxID=10212 RepID=A0A7J7JA82_BUGNE|nr:hypothetical protein EB796_018800 [Bugula neritina]